MNRIQSFFPSLVETEFNFSSGASPSFHPATNETSPHTFFRPLHYEPGYAYPLIVWLHSPDNNEHQMQKLMRLVSTRNYVAVAPRGPVSGVGGTSGNGFSWRQSSDCIDQSEQRIFECLDLAAAKFNIHARRIIISGHGSGGTMALRVALRFPGQFAGAVSIGGPLPREQTPLLRLREARRLQLLLVRGSNSRSYPQAQVCEDLRLLHTGAIPVILRQYPCGNKIVERMLSDMDRWIMETIVTDQPISTTATK